MTTGMKTPGTRPLSLLEHERNLLVRGELDALAGLEMEKRDLIAALPAQGTPNAPTLARLKQQAAVNAEIYQAALDGLMHARHRIEEVRSVLSEMKTYSGDGTVTSESTVQPVISRKA